MTGAPAGVRALRPQTLPLRAAVRLVVGVVVVLAVLSTFLDTASRGAVNPFNFFGFFTIQGNLLAAGVLLLAAVLQIRGAADPEWLLPVRAAVTTYMSVVGVVYNLLLAGLPGGVELAWANWVMHVGFPVYAVLDWVVAADRRALSYRVLRLVLVFPLAWVTVVLVRGAADGWVPYPFLDPASGYASVALYVVVIAVAVLAFGAVVILISRRARPVAELVGGARRGRA
ncbi:Pr6Pr family membrane protein [Arthrobacter antioxidans]|uniref:Pr6Pr family membrane protein n=1 Tax=Arthrobacter antioxidans TaxID=2895818 RepID=UPI001FFE99D4|nr:Pr6Pr family membrane protein [Arthrobacter antioxidans]